MELEKYYQNTFLNNEARNNRALLRQVKEAVKASPDQSAILCYHFERVIAFAEGGYVGEVHSLHIRNGHLVVSFAGALDGLLGKVPVKNVIFKDFHVLAKNVIAATKTPVSLVPVVNSILGKHLRTDPLDTEGFVLERFLGRRNNDGDPDTLVFETPEGNRKELSMVQARRFYDNLQEA